MAIAILRLPSVLNKRGRSRSAHYLDIKEGLFTRPVSIGSRAVGWPDHEVDAVNMDLHEGNKESAVVPLGTSLKLQHLMSTIKKQF